MGIMSSLSKAVQLNIKHVLHIDFFDVQTSQYFYSLLMNSTYTK